MANGHWFAAYTLILFFVLGIKSLCRKIYAYIHLWSCAQEEIAKSLVFVAKLCVNTQTFRLFPCTAKKCAGSLSNFPRWCQSPHSVFFCFSFNFVLFCFVFIKLVKSSLKFLEFGFSFHFSFWFLFWWPKVGTSTLYYVLCSFKHTVQLRKSKMFPSIHWGNVIVW